jgi:hypothetical protein
MILLVFDITFNKLDAGAKAGNYPLNDHNRWGHSSDSAQL